MKKFLVLYCMPAAGLEEWLKLPAEQRQAEETRLKGEWDSWAAAHKEQIKDTAGAGATKRATAAGLADVKNDVMLYSMLEAASHEEAAQLFVGHPHLQIPGAWIDIMPMNNLPG